MTIPPCMIYVDKEGTWFHEGAPIIRRDVVLLFYRSLTIDARDRYIIQWNGQVCEVHVEDTPFVVLAADFVSASKPGEKDRIVLTLIDDTREDLNPDTLTIGPDHVPYCRIQGGRFRARFSRSSYYQLARHILEERDTGRFFLSLNEARHYLPAPSTAHVGEAT